MTAESATAERAVPASAQLALTLQWWLITLLCPCLSAHTHRHPHTHTGILF